MHLGTSHEKKIRILIKTIYFCGSKNVEMIEKHNMSDVVANTQYPEGVLSVFF